MTIERVVKFWSSAGSVSSENEKAGSEQQIAPGNAKLKGLHTAAFAPPDGWLSYNSDNSILPCASRLAFDGLSYTHPRRPIPWWPFESCDEL